MLDLQALSERYHFEIHFETVARRGALACITVALSPAMRRLRVPRTKVRIRATRVTIPCAPASHRSIADEYQEHVNSVGAFIGQLLEIIEGDRRVGRELLEPM